MSPKSTFCRKCGQRLDDETRFCSKCGTSVEAGYSAGSAPYANHGYLPPSMPLGDQPGKGAGTASMVLGILCLVFALIIPIPFIDTLLGILGIIMAAVSKSKGYTGGTATAGLVCSIIGIGLGVLVCIACAACAMPFMFI